MLVSNVCVVRTQFYCGFAPCASLRLAKLGMCHDIGQAFCPPFTREYLVFYRLKCCTIYLVWSSVSFIQYIPACTYIPAILCGLATLVHSCALLCTLVHGLNEEKWGKKPHKHLTGFPVLEAVGCWEDNPGQKTWNDLRLRIFLVRTKQHFSLGCHFQNYQQRYRCNNPFLNIFSYLSDINTLPHFGKLGHLSCANWDKIG